MKKIVAAAVVAGLMGSGAAFAADAPAQTLAQSKGCLACHAIDKKVVGPAYKEVAAKYKTDKTAEAKLVEKVQKGGAGVWGQMPMPPQSVTPAEAKTLVAWVLSQK
jgi:cytochrome c